MFPWPIFVILLRSRPQVSLLRLGEVFYYYLEHFKESSRRVSLLDTYLFRSRCSLGFPFLSLFRYTRINVGTGLC
jgi:hypothetical protein